MKYVCVPDPSGRDQGGSRPIPTTSVRATHIVLVCLVLLSAGLSSGCGTSSARGHSQDLVNAYIQAVREQDRGALESLFDWTRETNDDPATVEFYPREVIDRELDRRMDRYAGMDSAEFRATLRSGDPAEQCFARISVRKPSVSQEAFTEYLWLTMLPGGGWALEPQDPEGAQAWFSEDAPPCVS
jgi:hypothetical protein